MAEAERFESWPGHDNSEATKIGRRLIFGAARHNIEMIVDALAAGADINYLDSGSGLSALHVAVGSNDLPLCRYLIEECGAGFMLDRFGRMPSVVAINCRVDDALVDYIVEKEAQAEKDAG